MEVPYRRALQIEIGTPADRLSVGWASKQRSGQEEVKLRLQESGDASQCLDDGTVLPIFALIIVQDVFGSGSESSARSSTGTEAVASWTIWCAAMVASWRGIVPPQRQPLLIADSWGSECKTPIRSARALQGSGASACRTFAISTGHAPKGQRVSERSDG